MEPLAVARGRRPASRSWGHTLPGQGTGSSDRLTRNDTSRNVKGLISAGLGRRPGVRHDRDGPREGKLLGGQLVPVDEIGWRRADKSL